MTTRLPDTVQHSAVKPVLAPLSGRRFRPHRIPRNIHPLTRRLFDEMNARRITIVELAELSGVGKDTFREWRYRSNPTVSNLEACFNALGLELTVVTREDDQ